MQRKWIDIMLIWILVGATSTSLLISCAYADTNESESE